jgi:hypothetical protein
MRPLGAGRREGLLACRRRDEVLLPILLPRRALFQEDLRVPEVDAVDATR